jgi:hypothetical protein
MLGTATTVHATAESADRVTDDPAPTVHQNPCEHASNAAFPPPCLSGNWPGPVIVTCLTDDVTRRGARRPQSRCPVVECHSVDVASRGFTFAGSFLAESLTSPPRFPPRQAIHDE